MSIDEKVWKEFNSVKGNLFKKGIDCSDLVKAYSKYSMADGGNYTSKKGNPIPSDDLFKEYTSLLEGYKTKYDISFVYKGK